MLSVYPHGLMCCNNTSGAGSYARTKSDLLPFYSCDIFTFTIFSSCTSKGFVYTLLLIPLMHHICSTSHTYASASPIYYYKLGYNRMKRVCYARGCYNIDTHCDLKFFRFL